MTEKESIRKRAPLRAPAILLPVLAAEWSLSAGLKWNAGSAAGLLAGTTLALALLLYILSKEPQTSGRRAAWMAAAVACGVCLAVSAGLSFGAAEGGAMTRTQLHLNAGLLAVLPLAVLSALAVLRPGPASAAAVAGIPPALLFLLPGSGFMLAADAMLDPLYMLGLGFSSPCYYFLCRSVRDFLSGRPAPVKEQEQHELNANQLAYADELTGLPNRRRLTVRLKDKLAGGGRRDGGFTALAVLNINHFKNINDSLGHVAGDHLLQQVARRISHGTGRNEELFSMGADEFAVMMPGQSSLEQCMQRGRELIALFESPVALDCEEYHISLSVGISVYPGDAETAEELIQNADTAVHNAKTQGVDIKRYRPSMQLKAKERLKLENDLRRALEREELYLVYQPKVDLTTQSVVGVEALLRWHHPKRGLVSPGEFIPVAEESGMIVEIGEWVLRTACSQNVAWQQAGYPPISVSVNLSMRQFLQPNLAGVIRAILLETGLSPAYVDLEITESMTMDKQPAFYQLRRLKEIGVSISIDDFGTGYCSLHYLKNMPIDRLKIDRSFVQDITRGGNDAAIVSTIASMAHHLKLKVTAEGVENEAQRDFLRSQHCDDAQGYLFGRPIRAEEFQAVYLGGPLPGAAG